MAPGSKKALFVEHLVTCGDPVRAAELAGFSAPGKQGPLLMRQASVRAALEERAVEPPALDPTAAPPVPTVAASEEEAEPSRRSDERPRPSPEQIEAVTLLLLRDVHLTTEHYRQHRPAIFTEAEFTPGATEQALHRRSVVQHRFVWSALEEAHERGWLEVVAITDEQGPTAAGHRIYQPSALGLELLASMDDEARLREVAEVAAGWGALRRKSHRKHRVKLA